MQPLIRSIVFLLVIVIAGCGTQNLRPTLDTNFEPLIIQFSDSALSLNRSVLAQLSFSEEQSEHQIVKNTLVGTLDSRLLPDDSFESLATVVAQKDVDMTLLFAEKLTNFLLNKNFACSEPLYYQYFQKRYRYENGIDECNSLIPFSLISRNSDETIVWLDPARVSSIHILFAGNDEGIVSKFGHVLLRLVVCPEDDRSSAACDKNLYEHITLGYRAHVDELSINTLKGLMGDYQAYLYAEEFMGSYRQYAIDEFRDMYSLPLNLSDSERINFVKSLAEIHWNYSGDYKFLTRNCATLLQDALRVIWPAYAQSENLKERFLRPDSFFDAMQSQPMTDSQVLADLALAETLGYFFSSTEAIYTKALNQVRTEMTHAYFESLDEYREVNPVKRYQDIKEDFVYLEKLKQDEILLGAQLLIEEYSAIKSRSEMTSGIARFFEKNTVEEVEPFMEQTLNDNEFQIFSECLLKPMQAYMSPKKRLNGIPSAKDLNAKEESDFDCKSDQNWTTFHRISEQFILIDESSWQPVNVAMFYWLESLNNVIRLSDLKQ